MAFTDMFHPVFLLSLGVILVITGIIVIYFEGKFRDQNHKINAMFSIVTTLVEKVNELKSEDKEEEDEENMKQVFIEPSSQHGGKLIEVSDDEIIEESEDDDETEDMEDMEDMEDIENVEDMEDVEDIENVEDMEDMVVEDVVVEDVETEGEPEEITITISKLDAEDVKEEVEKEKEKEKEKREMEYKKKTLPELRKMAVSQGLVFDASKLKKPELIKLFMTLEETQQ